MTSQEEWRRIAYEQSLGRQGRPVGTMASYEAYQREYQPRVEANNRFYDSVSRSAGAEAFDFGTAAPAPRVYGTGGHAGIGSLATGGISTSRPIRLPSSPPSRTAVALRYFVLIAVLTGVGAAIWAVAMEDWKPVEIWYGALVFGMMLATTIVVLLLLQLVLVGYEIYVVAGPLVREADALLELSLPWVLGISVAALTATLFALWALRRFRAWPRWARIGGTLAAAIGILTVIWPGWWPWHLMLSRIMWAWAQQTFGWMLLV
jgi:hypothetical protein